MGREVSDDSVQVLHLHLVATESLQVLDGGLRAHRWLDLAEPLRGLAGRALSSVCRPGLLHHLCMVPAALAVVEFAWTLADWDGRVRPCVAASPSGQP